MRPTLSRWIFLFGLAAAALMSACAGAAESEPLLRFGFLSDPHLNVASESSQTAFANALSHFAACDVDAVVMSGDLLDTGSEEEMQLVLTAWRSAFPNGRGPDGREVVPFVVWGNHDYMDASYMRTMTPDELASAYPHQMRNDKDRWWRELAGEPFPGEVYHRKIRGFSFVGAHWGHEDETGPWMEAHAAGVDTSRFFVHVQHPHPYGTVYGEASGPKEVKNLLSAYPNCLSLSGHSHLSLADDRALWQGAFVALTGSTPSRQVAVIRVYVGRVEIARRDMAANVELPLWTLSMKTVGSDGARELSSSAIAFDTKVRTAESIAQTTPFDSCDRRSRTAPAIAFRSTPPTGNVLLVR